MQPLTPQLSIVSSLRSVGFRHHGLSQAELELERGNKRAEDFLARHQMKPEDASSDMLLSGMSIDYTDSLYKLMKQNPLGDIKPLKQSFPRYCIPGRCFSAIEDDDDIRYQAITALSPSWMVDLELVRLSFHTDADNRISIGYELDEQDHPLFDIFPMCRHFIKPEIYYCHPIAISKNKWPYYPEGVIRLRMNESW